MIEKYYSANFMGYDPKNSKSVEWTVAIEGQPREIAQPSLDLDVVSAEIEWTSVDKIEPVQGSSLSLTLVSPSDRTLTELYKVAPATLFVTIMRDGELWWMGAIDPELYSEPYTTDKGYEVTITASDFGVLDRLDFDLTGIASINDIIKGCLNRMYPDFFKHRISDFYRSTSIDGETTAVDLTKLYVDTSNFYDEDGKPMTWREVLEAVLQPLGLRMVQRCAGSGVLFYLYDINALFTHHYPTKDIWWSSDDAQLDIDKTYDKVELTLSPYVPSDVVSEIDEEEVLKDAVPEGVCSEKTTTTEDLSKFVSQYSFYIAHGESNKYWGGLKLGRGAQFFRIRGGKDNCAGVVWDYALDPLEFKKNLTTGDKNGWNHLRGQITQQVHTALPTPLTQPCTLFPRFDWGGAISNWQKRSDGTEIAKLFSEPEPMITMPQFYTPANAIDKQKWSLREILTNNYYDRQRSARIHINAEMLLDVAPSPFETAQMSFWIRRRFNIEWAFVPCRLLLYNAQGEIIRHWQNIGQLRAGGTVRPDNVLEQTMSWEPGEGAWGDMYLAFYKSSYSASSDGSRRYPGFWDSDKAEWIANRPVRTAGPIGGILNDDPGFANFSGEFIPLPPEAGWVELQIGIGIQPIWAVFGSTMPATGLIPIHTPSEWLTVDLTNPDNMIAEHDVCNYLRWQLFRNVSIKEVQLGENGAIDTIKEGADDIVYSAWINKAAEDSFDLDTVVGTPGKLAAQTARCRIVDAQGTPIEMFHRANVHGSLEQLLIGTVYSQYAKRHNCLTGECSMTAKGLPVYTDAAAQDETYLVTSEVAHLIEGVSDITATQIEPDYYQGPVTT